jgi:putative transposase
MDFVTDQSADGRRFRSLTVVDIYMPDSLPIESEQTLKGEDVVRALSRVKISRGVPKMVHCDNGSELSSQVMDLWAYRSGVRMAFSRPGRPTEKSASLKWFATFPAECRKVAVYQREAGCLRRARSAVANKREYRETVAS